MREIAKVCLIALVLTGGPVAAQTSSSTNYRTDEYMFGAGGELDSQSSSYRAQSSLGALGIDQSASESYYTEAGFLTPSEPFLEMVVTEQSAEFGELSETSTKYASAQGGGCSCSFNVRSYLSSSYVVYTVSDPPTNENGVVLAAKGVLGAPSTAANVEEFGMNVVANPVGGIGANPINVPNGSFADGAASPGYNTADQFKYAVGDIIAQSPGTPGNKAVGQTNFTISYIAKRTAQTPAGLYQMDHVLVVVATY